MDSSGVSRFLSSARWWRGRISLTCSPTGRFESPLWAVFRSIWLTAMPKEGPWTRPLFTWHSVGGALPDYPEAGQRFDLALVFPEADGPEAWRRLTDRLAVRPPRYFSVDTVGDLESRSLGSLLQANPCPEECPSGTGTWINLQFEAPWAFPATDSAPSWQPDAEALLRSLHHAWSAFLGGAGEGEEDIPGVAERDLEICAQYWQLKRFGVPSRSRPGATQSISGFAGPLLVRVPAGRLARWWPRLLLGSEFHLGKGRHLGQGRFVPAPVGPVLDRRLEDDDYFLDTWTALSEKIDVIAGMDPLGSPGEETGAVLGVAEVVRAGRWRPAPIDVVAIPKHGLRTTPAPDGDRGPVSGRSEAVRRGEAVAYRPIALLPTVDRLVHQVLARALDLPLERCLTDAAQAYRRRHSVKTALARATAALQEGRHWVVRADVAAFFDEIPWEPLLDRLGETLPAPDPLLWGTLRLALSAPAQIEGRVFDRTRGLPQGSPLSPLLSNFYLSGFDAAIEAAGHRLVRYGDDFLILCRSAEQAGAALDLAAGLLGALGLSIREEKTEVLDARQRVFTFLGAELGGADFPPTEPDDPLVARPTYLTAPWQWAGFETGALVLREGRRLVSRVPLSHVSDLTLEGLGGISLALLDECLRRRIPVTLCRPLGHHLATLAPDPKAALEVLAAHHRRFSGLSEADRLAAAVQVATGKLEAYVRLLSELPGPETSPLRRKLLGLLARMPHAADADALRGYEGQGARLVFAFLARRIGDPFFQSRRRAPRERADPWNVLLDIGYHLLHHRLLALIKSRHLNPYLGFLHSPQNSYPSLVCDLQESFRSRVDRLLVRQVNRSVLRPEHFEQRPDGRWRLRPEPSRDLIRAFERELDCHHHGERYTWRRLLELQADAIRDWARGRTGLWIYAPGRTGD